MRVDEYNSFSSLLQHYARCVSRLEQVGVRVAEQCRLRTYERRLHHARSTAEFVPYSPESDADFAFLGAFHKTHCLRIVQAY